jgi:hypothetical protein
MGYVCRPTAIRYLLLLLHNALQVALELHVQLLLLLVLIDRTPCVNSALHTKSGGGCENFFIFF